MAFAGNPREYLGAAKMPTFGTLMRTTHRVQHPATRCLPERRQLSSSR